MKKEEIENIEKIASGENGEALLDIPEEIYHAEKRFISKHSLDIFRESPFKYKEMIEGRLERTTSAAMEFGTALHCAVLEPEKFAEIYVDAGAINRRTKEGKAQWESLIASGKKPLSVDDFSKISSIRDNIFSHEAAADLFSGKGLNEVSLFSTNAFKTMDGYKFKAKCRMDRLILKDNCAVIIDLKTASDVSDKAIQRAIANFRYDIQAYFYEKILCEITHLAAIDFIFVFVETKPPYEVKVVKLTEEWLEVAESDVRRDLELLRWFEEGGRKIFQTIETIGKPAWHKEHSWDDIF